MLIVGGLKATSAPAGGVALDATSHFDPGPGLEATSTLDTETAGAILPRQTRHQVVTVRILVDGVAIPARQLVGEIVLQRRRRTIDQLDFQLVADGWPVGHPWNLGGPPPGRAPIDLEAGYVTSSGVRWYRMLTEGLVSEAEIDTSGEVMLMRLRVLGKAARTQNARVTVRFLPGHGTARGVMVTEAAAQAGEAFISLPAGRTVRKAFEIADGTWRGPCEQLMELEGAYLAHDEDGVLTALPRLPTTDGEPAMVLRARDMLQGTLGIRWLGGGQVPTTLILTAEEELHDASEPCGRTTTRKTTETFANETPRRAKWRLLGGPAGPWHFEAVGPVGVEQPQRTLTRRVVTDTEKVCKTVVSTTTTTYSLRNLRTWRYEIDDNGPPTPGAAFIVVQNVDYYVVDESPQSNGEGSEHLYLWPVARLIKESEVFDQKVFDAEGYLVEKRKASKGLFVQRWALKGDGTPRTEGWEDIPLRATTTFTMGDGEGCLAGTREMYSPGVEGVPETSPLGPLFGEFTSLETVTYSHQGGYIIAEQHRRYGPHLPPGDLYYYKGGETSSHDREHFGLVSGKDVTYSVVGADGAAKLEIPHDFVADPAGRPQDGPLEPEALQGYLPQAERLNDGSTDEGVRGNTRLLESKCRSAKLEQAHIPYAPDPQRVEYAEDQADLDSLCLQRLREGAPVEAELLMPACFALRKGMEIAGIFPALDFAHLMVVDEIDDTFTPSESTAVTRVKGVIRAI